MEKFLEYKNKYLYIKHFGGAKKKTNSKKILEPDIIIPVIKRVLIISGHGSNLSEISIYGTVPEKMNIVFTNHSTEEIESDPIFENYIITNNYDTLNTIFI